MIFLGWDIDHADHQLLFLSYKANTARNRQNARRMMELYHHCRMSLSNLECKLAFPKSTCTVYSNISIKILSEAWIIILLIFQASMLRIQQCQQEECIHFLAENFSLLPLRNIVLTSNMFQTDIVNDASCLAKTG